MMILITGGSGSGKSLIAEKIGFSLKKDKLYYIATMEAYDSECLERISRHRKQRAGKGFITAEIPYNIISAADNFEKNSSALIECISNLLANEQFDRCSPDPVYEITEGIFKLREGLENIIIVTNETAEDIPPKSGNMIQYLRNIGRINRILAEKSDVVIEAVCGVPLFLRGEEFKNEIGF